jgi:hypothetical protein
MTNWKATEETKPWSDVMPSIAWRQERYLICSFVTLISFKVQILSDVLSVGTLIRSLAHRKQIHKSEATLIPHATETRDGSWELKEDWQWVDGEEWNAKVECYQLTTLDRLTWNQLATWCVIFKFRSWYCLLWSFSSIEGSDHVWKRQTALNV